MHLKRYGSVAGKIGTVAAMTAGVLVATASPSFAATTLTLSSATGPVAGGATITASTADGSKPFTSSNVANVEFQLATSCSTTYATVNASSTTAAVILATGTTGTGTVTLIAGNKIAVKTPAPLPASGKYQICVYAGQTVASGTGSSAVAGSPLLASGTYSVATAAGVPTFTPSTGSAQGGTLITVTSSALPTTAGSITASIGGVAATTVTPNSATQFTMVVPPHAAGSFPIAITTAGGTVTSTTTFTYSNGITVLPSTSPNAGTITLDVLGVGFSSLSWDPADVASVVGTPDLATATSNSAFAHVYLVDGAYDPTAGSDASGKTNGEETDCNGVIVISDTELLCQLHLHDGGPAGAAITSGTYTVTIVDLGGVAATLGSQYPSIISSGATFTVGPYMN